MDPEDPQYRTHTNKEKKVKCPYCDSVLTSRGLYQHVWRSDDDAHGGHKEVPDDWEETEPEVVGEGEVSVHVPTSKEYDHERSTCKYCGEKFKGTHGLAVHLSRVDDSVHPDDADVETAGIRAPDEFSDEATLSVGSDDAREGAGTQDPPEGYVPLSDVVEVIAALESQGDEEAAEVLRKAIRPYR